MSMNITRPLFSHFLGDVRHVMDSGHDITAWFRGDCPLKRAIRYCDLKGGFVVSHEWKIEPMSDTVRIYGVVPADYFTYVLNTPFPTRYAQTHKSIRACKPRKTTGLDCHLLPLSECFCAHAHSVQLESAPLHFKIDVDVHALGVTRDVYDRFLSSAFPELCSALKEIYKRAFQSDREPLIALHDSSFSKQGMKPSFRVLFGPNIPPFRTLTDASLFWSDVRTKLSHPMLTAKVLDVCFSPNKTDRLLGCSKWVDVVDEARVLCTHPHEAGDDGAGRMRSECPEEYQRIACNALDAGAGLVYPTNTRKHNADARWSSSATAGHENDKTGRLIACVLKECRLCGDHLQFTQKRVAGGDVWIPLTPVCLLRSCTKRARPLCMNRCLRHFDPSEESSVPTHKTPKAYFSLRGNALFHKCLSTKCCPDGKKVLVAEFPYSMLEMLE